MNNNWSTSNYRQRKAARQAKVEPTWQTNPETGEKFLIRRVNAMAYAMAGELPRGLTMEAVEGWKEEGVEVETPQGKMVLGPKEIAAGRRNIQLMGRIIVESLVTPKVVENPTEDDEITLADLDDSDAQFIVRVATGQTGTVALQGGGAMNVADLKSLHKTTGRRARTGTNG